MRREQDASPYKLTVFQNCPFCCPLDEGAIFQHDQVAAIYPPLPTRTDPTDLDDFHQIL